MNWLLWSLVLHLPVLFVLYVLWIQHERGGLWKLCHIFGLIGFIPDVVANYTTLALIFWREPSPGAFTFSKQLWYLSRDGGWRGRLARPVAAVLDRLAPSGNHIHR